MKKDEGQRKTFTFAINEFRLSVLQKCHPQTLRNEARKYDKL